MTSVVIMDWYHRSQHVRQRQRQPQHGHRHLVDEMCQKRSQERSQNKLAHEAGNGSLIVSFQRYFHKRWTLSVALWSTAVSSRRAVRVWDPGDPPGSK